MNASERHFQKTLDRIFSLTDFERGSRTPDHRMFHLERIKLLLSRISNPHLGTPTIHIAGSKGKGRRKGGEQEEEEKGGAGGGARGTVEGGARTTLAAARCRWRARRPRPRARRARGAAK